MALRGPNLELGVGRRVHPRHPLARTRPQVDAVDDLRVAAVEPFGEPQDRAERANRAPQPAGQVAVALVASARRRLPVVARDERDDLHLGRLEAPQISILDQVVGMAVVALVADVQPDVVQPGSEFQPFALALAEAVDAARLREDRERQPRDVPGVFGNVPAALAELEHAPPADVGQAVDRLDACRVALQVVEHDPFAKREIAERQVLGAEMAQQRVEQHGAGDRDVRAPRVEPRQAQPRVEVERREPLAQLAQRLHADASIAERFGRHAALQTEGDGAEAQDRARRPDHAIEPPPRELLEPGAALAFDMLHEPPFVASAQRVAAHEPFGEADDAELEAAPALQFRRGAERHFHAAAADVDDDRRRSAHVDPVARGKMDQPRLLRAGDHPHSDPRLPCDLADEVAAVFRFARRARGDRQHLVHSARFREPLELDERLQRRRHRRVREALAVEAARAQPDHFLLAVDHLERQVGTHLDDDHV